MSTFHQSGQMAICCPVTNGGGVQDLGLAKQRISWHWHTKLAVVAEGPSEADSFRAFTVLAGEAHFSFSGPPLILSTLMLSTLMLPALMLSEFMLSTLMVP